MAINHKQSSSQIASLASRTLSNTNSSETAKQLAASVLSQASSAKQTGKDMEAKASAVLQSSKYSQETKALAGSVLSQSNKNR